MGKALRIRCGWLPFCCALLFTAGSAFGQGWTSPTADELSMKGDPKAPNAPAIVLSYEEIDDGDSAEVLLHVRIKVLTAAGLSAGTIELPERIVSNDEFDRKLSARTIHASGAIIEYKATPENSRVIDAESGRPRRVISLPAVEVGSILEYTCHFAGQNSLYTYLIGAYAPAWRVQGRYFTRAAHFILKAPPNFQPATTRWVANLPAGTQLVRNKNLVTLDLKDIPAEPAEEFMPPSSAVLYGVRFFYFSEPREKYWGTSGAAVDDQWLDFVAKRKPIVAAVRELILPTDTDEQKLHKLYDAVEKMDNTDLTREHMAREEKHVSQNSEDIWTRRRGDSQELTLLFVALARAAGYTAYPMAVSSRDHAVFNQDVLSWSQMDSTLAIVEVNGHDMYFDPGTRRCTFATVAPWHSNVMGVSTEAKLIKIRKTPPPRFATSLTERQAELSVAADGSVGGIVRVAWVDNAGLALRRQAIREDRQAVEVAVEKEIQEMVPATVSLKLESLEHLDDTTGPMLATFKISGTLGMATAKRLILPEQFFASRMKPLLAPASRTTPVVFPVAYATRDQVTIHLPASLGVETLPARKTLNLAKDVVYDGTATAPAGKHVLVLQRAFVLAKVDYTPGEYAPLHHLFAEIAAADQEQIVLAVAPQGK